MIRPIFSLVLAAALACGASAQGLSYAPGRGPAGATGAQGPQGEAGPAGADGEDGVADPVTGDPGRLVVIDGTGEYVEAAGASQVVTAHTVQVTSLRATGIVSGPEFLDTQDVASDHYLARWRSQDGTDYGIKASGSTGAGSFDYAVGLLSEGVLRIWTNYLGSNYLFGPHRFTGVLNTSTRIGATNYTLTNANETVYAIATSTYTLPAIDTSGIYQGDGDGASVARYYRIVRDGAAGTVTVNVTGSDIIRVQGSSVSAGLTTLSYLSTDSIDLTQDGAGVLCHETYYRVSTGPDVFQAAWMCSPIGLGIEASP